MCLCYVQAPGVYHTWLAQADLKVIQKVVGGEGAGETSVDLQSILAHSNEVRQSGFLPQEKVPETIGVGLVIGCVRLWRPRWTASGWRGCRRR